MKFLADMGISPRTVDALRQQGYNAVHLGEQGRLLTLMEFSHFWFIQLLCERKAVVR
ncbi:MAG: DUF5615 family PIN-like protein [Nostocaceae cyanobacterium]|nr:DUF5615 family PIN-like protein [Nostocaceae cyanobacterium]